MLALRLTIVALMVIGISGLPGLASAGSNPDPDVLLDLSPEQLMNVKVTSASKKEQALNEVPAAIHVISREDLRRSGATTIADALRLVPGMHVARVDANKWAVSARGFNSRFANKMPVLIDGRSNYATLFSGVFWEALDIPFDEIERIEVIRGPGATVRDANAVNGVVNIITRHAEDSQGFYATSGYGTTETRTSNQRSSPHSRLAIASRCIKTLISTFPPSTTSTMTCAPSREGNQVS